MLYQMQLYCPHSKKKKKKKTKFKIFTREINLQMNVDECFAWAHQKMRRKACKWKMRFYAAFGSM